MSTKRYKLLKDLPDAKAGEIYSKRSEYSDRYCNEDAWNGKSPVIEANSYFSWQVENNPEWFSLIEDEKSVFDEKKINERLNQLVEMEEAFNAARLTHPLAGFKYDTFRDYAKEKHNEAFPSHQSIKEEQPLRHFNEVENERMKEWAERYSKESKIKRQNPTEERLRWRDRKNATEKTEVTFLSEFAGVFGGKYNYTFWATKEISPDRFPFIQQAIASILNNIEYHYIPGFKYYQHDYKKSKT